VFVVFHRNFTDENDPSHATATLDMSVAETTKELTDAV
jgi:hypothetical protein